MTDSCSVGSRIKKKSGTLAVDDGRDAREDARMGCENVETSATSLPVEIINPVKSTKSYSPLLHARLSREGEG